MTDYVCDIARWQRDLPLEQVKKAGFGAVNIKVSHGMTYGSAIYPNQADDVARAREARELGIRMSTFHWLTGEATGSAQAQLAFSRMKAMGGPVGMAHSLDCEDQDNLPTWTTITSYVSTMRSLLGRPIFIYTGDWWWKERMAGRNGTALSPYLWAVPNRGWPRTYPGDTAPEWIWDKSVGGWSVLSALQYDDSRPPFGDGVTTTVKVSKTALRDRSVWKAVAGVAW